MYTSARYYSIVTATGGGRHCKAIWRTVSITVLFSNCCKPLSIVCPVHFSQMTQYVVFWYFVCTVFPYWCIRFLTLFWVCSRVQYVYCSFSIHLPQCP